MTDTQGRRTDAADEARLTFTSSGQRQVRPTALGRGTHGVPDVRRLVEAQFHVAFPHRVWVAGQVDRPAGTEDGLRFVLRSSTGQDPYSLPCWVPADGLGAVRDLLARAHDADVEDVVREGRLARVGGLLRYDAERGTIVLLVSELDPTPTAQELADARETALAAVREQVLGERQRSLHLATAPLQVSLVGARADAALHRVREQIAACPYDVDAQVHEVVLTGPDATAQLTGAVRAAAGSSDVVLLVRDEGRPLGLAPYDALDVARSVAEAGVPVVAALGGQGTRTAVDEVAWASMPTAEAAVGWLLGVLGDVERRLSALGAEVTQAADEAGDRCRALLAAGRDQASQALEEAVERSTAARRRRRLQLRVGCAVLAVGVVAVALGVARPLLLLGLVVPVLVLMAVELWWRYPRNRRSSMSQRDEEFTQVLSRLHAVRDELRTTTSPERVAGLRARAAELVADGERLLGLHLGTPDPAPAQVEAGQGDDARPQPPLEGPATVAR